MEAYQNLTLVSRQQNTIQCNRCYVPVTSAALLGVAGLVFRGVAPEVRIGKHPFRRVIQGVYVVTERTLAFPGIGRRPAQLAVAALGREVCLGRPPSCS